MSKEIKHTPTPWRWVSDCCHGFDYLVGDEYKAGKGGCTSDGIILNDGSVCGEHNKAISKEDANAKHIVKCVNENEALHARIKELEAEKQVWLPISGKTPEELVGSVVYVPDYGLYGVAGKCNDDLLITDGIGLPWWADMDYEPTHYMVLPSPPCMESKGTEMNKEVSK